MTDVAAFDFDGTLTDGGSVFDFLAAVAGRKTVLRATAGLAPRLAHAALTGGTVADQTGFESVYHFSRQFKRMRGVSPTHYRATFADQAKEVTQAVSP